jgi:hypothetical protein
MIFGKDRSRTRTSRRNESVPCAMHKLQLTLACGRYDRTQPLIDGRVQVDNQYGSTFLLRLPHG